MRKAAPLLLGLLLLAPATKSAGSTAHGILPDNSMRIPVGAFAEGHGVTQREFNAVLDRIEQIYAPIIEARGGILEVQRKWKDSQVNAKAQRITPRYIIEMFGGLARHDAITPDGFALVACHEIGHHLAGAPRKRGRHWASIEGQADYFAPLKCLRRFFRPGESLEYLGSGKADPYVVKQCQTTFSARVDQAFCARSAMAGLSLANLFHAFETELPAPNFQTPDTRVVDATYNRWPATQCRLDTYLAGALCTKPISPGHDYEDPAPGTCTRAEGFRIGTRPTCWYKPPSSALPGLNL